MSFPDYGWIPDRRGVPSGFEMYCGGGRSRLVMRYRSSEGGPVWLVFPLVFGLVSVFAFCCWDMLSVLIPQFGRAVMDWEGLEYLFGYVMKLCFLTVPVFFATAFVIAVLYMYFEVCFLCFGSQVIVADHSGVRVTGRLFGLCWKRTAERGDIKCIVEVEGKSGDDSPCWSVYAHLDEERRVRLVKVDSQEASDWFGRLVAGKLGIGFERESKS